jgi:hypothetical protein
MVGRGSGPRNGQLFMAVAWGLSAFMIASFVVVGTVLWFSLLDGAKRDARSMASALQQYVARIVEVSHLVAEDARHYLAQKRHLAGLPDDAEAHGYFRQLVENLPEGSAIIFVDHQGTVVVQKLFADGTCQPVLIGMLL